MSQKGTQSLQTTSVVQAPSSGLLEDDFCLDEVDVTEQIRIQQQLTGNLESLYEEAIQEAMRCSLLGCSETVIAASAQEDSGDKTEASTILSATSADLVSSMDRTSLCDVDDSSDEVLGATDLAASQPCSAAGAQENCLRNNRNGQTPDLGDTTDGVMDHFEAVPRSRRSRFERRQQHKLEMLSGMDRINNQVSEEQQGACAMGCSSGDGQLSVDHSEGHPSHYSDSSQLERRPLSSNYRSNQFSSLELVSDNNSGHNPSLEGVNDYRTERTPSLERVADYRANRVSSLERVNGYRSERRPSLDRVDIHRSERRPSLDRIDTHRSERRPSLDRVNTHRSERRPSLDRMADHQGQHNERRPSLEHLEQQGLERRPSLELIQNAAKKVQSHNSREDANGSSQGINTLRPWPLGEDGVPRNWNILQLPDMEKGELYHLVALSPADREYSAITVDFEEAGLKVASVERLQNLMLLERFNHEKAHLLKRRPPDFDLNEKYLYHGTQANQHCLCEEGLDHRLSFQGCFGRGIYFSDNPRKCMQYATSACTALCASTRPLILVCRVLLGEMKVYAYGEKDSSLKREPEKPSARGGWRYYDSVQGIPVDYPEFVVYDNRRSMIEYIVTFEEVAYRAPPTKFSYQTYESPTLYKTEPVALPIPEEELDRLYMLLPDTDSEGSCDEHTRDVERLREQVKRGKAKRLGIPYRPPTKEEKRNERLHWKRVCYYNCPPDSPLFEIMQMKKQQDKEDRKKRKQKERTEKAAQEGVKMEPGEMGDAEDALGAAGGSVRSGTDSIPGGPNDRPEPDDYEPENETVGEVLSTLIADFLNITTTDDVSVARHYILDNSMDLDKALCHFFREM